MKNILLVAAGGGIGAVMRYGIQLLIKSPHFPTATLLINIMGSFVIGILMAGSIKEKSISDTTMLFLATGICGGFTTFSAFSLENLLLIQSGRYTLAFIYSTVSVLAGFSAAFLGFTLFTLK